MTREDQAGSLGRWLDRAPGSPPPEDLEADVIEAVYALRPDLAPAPRLSVDDILSSVTRGPLADPERTGASSERPNEGAEVVPFPIHRTTPPEVVSEEQPSPPTGRRGLLWMWVGGTGGLGMALVAAATLLLVATPAIREAAAPAEIADRSASPAASSPAASTGDEIASPAAPPPLSETSSPEVERGLVAAPAAEHAQSRAAQRPQVQPPPSDPAAGPVLDIRGGVAYREPTMIAEALEKKAPAGASVAEAAAEQAPSPEVDADDLVTLRDKAEPRKADGASWRKLVDADVLARMDAGIARAEALRAAGDLRSAADALSAVIQPPARAGQHLATLAARDYLSAGDPRAAAEIAQQGLGLSSASSPERSALMVAYGDALRALGEPDAAADVYKRAR